MTGCECNLETNQIPPLWILRHGQTIWNAEGRLQGRLDSPLTLEGIAQAYAQRTILERAELPSDVRVYCSTSGRARHTAQIAIGGFGISVTYDEALVEIGMGGWQGSLAQDILDAHPSLSSTCKDPNLWKFNGPGCESLDEMTARVKKFLVCVKQPAVIITHGITSRLLRCLVLGLAPEKLSSLPGGQGVVHHVANGRAQVLRL